MYFFQCSRLLLKTSSYGLVDTFLVHSTHLPHSLQTQLTILVILKAVEFIKNVVPALLKPR